jgi:hypothetical protein
MINKIFGAPSGAVGAESFCGVESVMIREMSPPNVGVDFGSFCVTTADPQHRNTQVRATLVPCRH